MSNRGDIGKMGPIDRTSVKSDRELGGNKGGYRGDIGRMGHIEEFTTKSKVNNLPFDAVKRMSKIREEAKKKEK
jgi:hypothetical protein